MVERELPKGPPKGITPLEPNYARGWMGKVRARILDREHPPVTQSRERVLPVAKISGEKPCRFVVERKDARFQSGDLEWVKIAEDRPAYYVSHILQVGGMRDGISPTYVIRFLGDQPKERTQLYLFCNMPTSRLGTYNCGPDGKGDYLLCVPEKRIAELHQEADRHLAEWREGQL